MNWPAWAGARHVNPAAVPTGITFEFTVPEITTSVPGLPPVQVTESPCDLTIVAAVAGLVQTKSGFERVTLAVNEPTSAPPEPLNVNTPPDEGIAPAASAAENAPLMPACPDRVVS